MGQLKRTPIFPLLFTLWHGLHFAFSRHPLLWYRLKRAPSRYQKELPAYQLGGMYLVTITALVGGFWWWLSAGFPPEPLIIGVGVPACIVVTQGVCLLILHEQARGHLPLLGITPSGMLGAFWALTTRYLRNDARLFLVHQWINLFHMLWLLALMPIFLINLLMVFQLLIGNPTRMPLPSEDLSFFAYAFAWLIVSRCEYLYATIHGAMLGMILPTVRYVPPNALTLSLFVGLWWQLCTYGVLILGGHFLLDSLGVAWWLEVILWLTWYFAVREISLLGVCWLLARRLGVNLAEVLNAFRTNI